MNPKMDLLLSSSLHDPGLLTQFYVPRFNHRLSLIKIWGIETGQQILDVGCGQGESCLVLALEVGDSGHVTGIDIARPEYGTPFSMGEAHEYVGKSALGPRITFHRADAPSFLGSLGRPPSTVFDSVVLCHSLWYFPNGEAVHVLFKTLADARIPSVYLAEYSYLPSNESQVPHILAAKAQALLYNFRAPHEPDAREQNVRAGSDQKSILAAAQDAGFSVQREGVFTPADDMLEGRFEVNFVLSENFRQRVRAENLPEEQEAEILAYVQRVGEEMERLKKTGPMDVWWAVLKLD
jgi:SAM-dependent methyltransferase